MDQEKIKKVVVVIWVVLLLVFGTYIVRLYAKGIDSQIDTEMQEVVSENTYSNFENSFETE